MLEIIQEKIFHTIKKAGGIYVAISDFPEANKRLVLFLSPQTHTTLAMPMDEILTGGIHAVHAHIEASNIRFGILPKSVL